MKPTSIAFCVEKPIGRSCLETALGLPDVRVVAICARDAKDAWWGSDDFAGLARKHDIPLVKRAELLSFDFDILISAGYPFVIDAAILNHANRFCLNIHLGPLPRWRGCNTNAHAILAGDKSFAVTIHRMESQLDSGPIIVREEFAIDPDSTGRELFVLAEEIGKKTFSSWLSRICQGYQHTMPQEPALVAGVNGRDSITPFKNIALDLPLPEVYRLARALDFPPWEPPALVHSNKRFFVFIGDSAGRDQAALSSFKRFSVPSLLGDLPLQSENRLLIEGFKRPLCLCAVDNYAGLYQLKV